MQEQRDQRDQREESSNQIIRQISDGYLERLISLIKVNNQDQLSPMIKYSKNHPKKTKQRYQNLNQGQKTYFYDEISIYLQEAQNIQHIQDLTKVLKYFDEAQRQKNERGACCLKKLGYLLYYQCLLRFMQFSIGLSFLAFWGIIFTYKFPGFFAFLKTPSNQDSQSKMDDKINDLAERYDRYFKYILSLWGSAVISTFLLFHLAMLCCNPKGRRYLCRFTLCIWNYGAAAWRKCRDFLGC